MPADRPDVGDAVAGAQDHGWRVEPGHADHRTAVGCHGTGARRRLLGRRRDEGGDR
jgi:hypothetical protein